MTLYVIRMPEALKSNVLCDPLLGHEFGHVVWDELRLADQLKYLVEHDGDLILRVAQRRATDVDQLRRQCRDVSLLWLEELCCDVAGIFLFGYSYLCAFARFMHIRERLDLLEEKGHHPPLRLRMRAIDVAIRVFDPLVGHHRSPSHAALCAECEAWRTYDSAIPTWNSPSAMHEVVLETLGRRLPEIVHGMWKSLTTQAGSASVFDADAVEHASEQLSSFVLPASLPRGGVPLPEPLAYSVITSAGWAFRLRGYPGWTARVAWDQEECERRLVGLLERAVEASELVRRLRSVR